mgnify:CR=1 FL=1
MKVVYMGTPDFAVAPMESILAAGHEIIGVFTQPDKPKGRGKAVQFTPVKEVALAAGIPVYQPKKVRDPEFIEQFRALDPDAAVVLSSRPTAKSCRGKSSICPNTAVSTYTRPCSQSTAARRPSSAVSSMGKRKQA